MFFVVVLFCFVLFCFVLFCFALLCFALLCRIASFTESIKRIKAPIRTGFIHSLSQLIKKKSFPLEVDTSRMNITNEFLLVALRLLLFC